MLLAGVAAGAAAAVVDGAGVCAGAAVLAGAGAVEAGVGAAGAAAVLAAGGVDAGCSLLPQALSISMPANVALYRAAERAESFITRPVGMT